MVSFLMMKVSVEFFQKNYNHCDFQYQVDSIVVSIDYVPVFVFVILDLQLQFLVDVVIVNIQFQIEFILVKKLQRNGVAIQHMDLVFVQYISQSRRILEFAEVFAVYY